MNKKAQQEIVGLVVIVLIVSIIGLVFLSFMVGRGEVEKDNSVELSNLLNAVMLKSSDCAISFIPEYDNVEELAKSCYSNRACLDGRGACEVLEEVLEGSVSKGLDVGSGNVNKGYELNVRYRDLELDDVGEEIIEVIVEGEMTDCSLTVGASRLVDVGFGSGAIEFGLRVCRN